MGGRGCVPVLAEWEERGHTVFTENQNSFALRGRTATLGGKPDLVALKGESGTIIDVKTGSPSPAHSVQVMLYMYAVPRAMGRHHGVVVYRDHEVPIPAAAMDEMFIRNLAGLVRRLSASEAARRVPSPRGVRVLRHLLGGLSRKGSRGRRCRGGHRRLLTGLAPMLSGATGLSWLALNHAVTGLP